MDLPEVHDRFLRTALDRFRSDRRLVGVAAGGSYLTGGMDEFSDLDLVIAVEPTDYANVLGERKSIARSLGPLLAAFTGDHVHEPRLLICLYGPPLLHVDLKFVSLDDVAKRVEDPIVLWERDGRLRAALATVPARYPEPDPQWIEDRFWTWVHYIAGKIGRGELFEAVGGLAFLRELALGPLALRQSGARPTGVRKLESAAPALAGELRLTVPAYDARSCLAALRASVAIYRKLRAVQARGLRRDELAEFAAMEYVDSIEVRLAPR